MNISSSLIVLSSAGALINYFSIVIIFVRRDVSGRVQARFLYSGRWSKDKCIGTPGIGFGIFRLRMLSSMVDN